MKAAQVREIAALMKVGRGTSMTERIERLIGEILKREGWPTYTNDPADRGGPTKGGVTLGTLKLFRSDDSLTARDVEDLTEVEARAIYRRRYIEWPRFDRIRDGRLFVNVADAGVLHGTAWAARRLQEVAGVQVDGIVGPVTLAAVNVAPARALNLHFTARRVQKVANIAAADLSQVRFLRGWINRALSFLDDEATR